MRKRKEKAIRVSENQLIYDALWDRQTERFKDKRQFINNTLIILVALLIADLVYLGIVCYFTYLKG